MEVRTCEKCNTPLDGRGACVTCAAVGRGLVVLSRSGYASIREMLDVLEAGGLAGEIEQVPPRREQEVQHPLWNLYAPEGQVEQAGMRVGTEEVEKDGFDPSYLNKIVD